MDMFDEARAMSGTLELCRLTQDELARQMGVSQSYVANKLRLLNFSNDMQKKIRESGITERHARAILRLDNEKQQSEVIKKVKERSLTVRECEALVDSMVDLSAPEIIGCAERHERIDTFAGTLKRSVDTLRSLGIDAAIRQSYYGNKMYITVCIDGE